VVALITYQQLIARPGFDNVDQGQAEAVIEDASALVADIAAPVVLTPETLPPAIVPVIVAMVRRGLFNPLGRSGETLGDYTWQGSGSLYATKQEKAIIRKAAGTLGAANATLDSDLPLPPWLTGGAFENEFLDSL
jgi:hypothetical protein